MTGRSCGVCGDVATGRRRGSAPTAVPRSTPPSSIARPATTRRPLARRPGRTGGREPAPIADETVAADLGAESIESSRPVRRIVPLALMAVAATVGAMALAAGDPADDATRPRPVPTLDGTLRNDAPRPIPSATPTARVHDDTRDPSPTPVATPAPIDPGDLPAMEATHLAVIGERRRSSSSISAPGSGRSRRQRRPSRWMRTPSVVASSSSPRTGPGRSRPPWRRGDRSGRAAIAGFGLWSARRSS